MNVLIKNVDENAYKLAKMLAIRDGKPVGKIVSESIRALAEKRKNRKGRLSDLPALDFGAENAHLSEHIDDILYGSR